MKTSTLLVASALLVFSPSGFAQSTAPDTPPVATQDSVDFNALLSQAQSLQGQQQFIEAAEIYMQITEAQPENGVAWFNLGYCLHLAGELDLAINAHRKAATFEQFAGIGQYNLGCAYALLGETDDAFEALAASYEAGFDLGNQLDADSDLDSLRDDPRFEELVEMAPPRGGGMGGAQTIVENARAYIEQNGPALLAKARTWAENAQAMAQAKIQEIRHIAEDEEQMAALRAKLEQSLARAHEAFSAWRVSQGDPEVVETVATTAPDLEQLIADANEQFTRSNFEEAAELYGVIVKHDEDNGMAWFRLGYALHFEEQIEKALVAHEKAASFDQFRPIALYNLACAHSLLGHTDAAFEALDKCKEAEFNQLANMDDDGDFDNIRDDPRFVAFLESLSDG